jgi:two-component system copper resistance phosphate regulon response regulator CusR
VKILLVEDDARYVSVLQRGLSEYGHVIDHESDGEFATDVALRGQYDAIVLDVGLPRRNGFEIARELRSRAVRTPILMLTNRDDLDQRVEGLDAGADDYLAKPCYLRELEARLRALARRDPQHVSELSSGDVRLDLTTRTARRGGRVLELTFSETALLEYFLRNAGIIVSKTMIEEALYSGTREIESNTIEAFVSRLRAKLRASGDTDPITTLRGLGYRFGPAA